MDRPHDVLAKMLIKVKTLTGKEIEIDIEPTDKVERIKVQSNSCFGRSEIVELLPQEVTLITISSGACGREGRHPTSTAASHLLW